MWKVFLPCLLALALVVQTAQADFEAFLGELRTEITEKGYDVAAFNETFEADFSPRGAVQKQRKRAPEKNWGLTQYAAKIVSPWRKAKGNQKFQENKAALLRTGAEYNVHPALITALWGVETSYGGYMGNHKVLPALATLAYNSKRKAFFRRELFAALEVHKQGHKPATEMLGSWAGAMGQSQFMPSSFLGYAKDGNADGRIDIWDDTDDVFASAANYLKRHKWDNTPQTLRHGALGGYQRVILGKFLPADLKLDKHLRTEAKTLEEWRNLGLYAVKGKLPAGDARAKLYLPNGVRGKAYLTYHNFDVIMRWNHSPMFAFAVLTLAQQITTEQGV